MKEIKLQGSIVNISAPAPLYKYTIDVSKLTWAGKLRNFISELRDAIIAMDEEYAVGPRRGRNIAVKVKTVRLSDGKEELRVLDIPVVPSRVENILSNTRTKLYWELNSLCVNVQKIDLGRKKKRLYFLPNSRVNDFVEAVRTCNNQIKEANEIIKNYLNSTHFKRLNKILKEYGYDEIRPVNIPKAPEIKFMLMPVTFDPDLILEHVNEKYKDEIRIAIEREKSRILEAAVEKIKRELASVINTLIEKPSLTLKDIKDEVDRVSALAKDVGMSYRVSLLINEIRETIEEAPETIKQEKLKNIANERLKTLLEQMAEVPQ